MSCVPLAVFMVMVMAVARGFQLRSARSVLTGAARGVSKQKLYAELIKPADLFSKWAATGRDEVMADGHKPAVREMLAALALEQNGAPFSFVDIGCGNGWVCRKQAKRAECTETLGVDGATNMIKKADMLKKAAGSTKCSFKQADLTTFTPDTAYDVALSMEVLYYLQPEEIPPFLKALSDRWVKPSGLFVMGVDHYYENTESHGWAKLNNTHMTLWREAQWREEIERAGFEVLRQWRAAKREGMQEGTMAILARNKAV
ncbi:S-adenosyl-L-methionine-dependent methyltransferase [Ochromonadaceae sp. CCMP2298]|nr:S-adenosyl-L-methionine-dependent methyltransferase [Ochromonadaceae sp. CCMP2298]|mmetsp:Transcript_32167/g.70878  ORF Transcript_32167/g.70878 Transcript_32167/m.70878 type:complete len:259 (+) Transcript_32167:55-831(+)|eukprot:CAMPEP_0173183922 /NCGR_PEP_ID=MMETSP1141-20130122/8668_1 /TAXON_ID=483371 /ORGANISM="non described non described, Strain CCMP2298" /LENGTH=258 /DNA_ID=CAMNT_0014107193 /DNA_START=8 /DNA_END=784 /DNA_ORIENTATION=+